MTQKHVLFDSRNRPTSDYNPNGVIVYEGPSQFDSSPIVAIATGLKRPSRNAKTGGMIQITMLSAGSLNPVDASGQGADSSVCGDCKLRGKYETDSNGKTTNSERICYVNQSNAALAIFDCYKRGGYRKLSVWELTDFFAGKEIRLGSYGDPFTVPLMVWESLLARAAKFTAYTHAWRRLDAWAYKAFCMASVDSPAEKLEANLLGWRTFRLLLDTDGLEPGEAICPATNPKANPVQCITCGLCNGISGKGKDIGVVAHGIAPKVKAYKALRLNMERPI